MNPRINARPEQTPDHHPKVFVSYRRVESAMLATLMETRFKVRGIDVFVDTRAMDGGGPFPERLLAAIESADVFLCLLGKTTLDSEWVQREIRHAHEQHKIMIPVFQEDFVPPPIAETPHLDALLKSEGVHIMDVKNIYVDESLEDLAQMIQQSVPASVPIRTTSLRLSLGWIGLGLASLLVLIALFLPGLGSLFSSVPTPTSTLTETFPPPTFTRTYTPSPEPTFSPSPTESSIPTATLADFFVLPDDRFRWTIGVEFAWLRETAQSGGSPIMRLQQYAAVEANTGIMPVYEADADQWWWYVRSSGTSLTGWVEQQSITLALVTPAPPFALNGQGGGSVSPDDNSTSTPLQTEITPTLEVAPVCNLNERCDMNLGENISNCLDCVGSSNTLPVTCNLNDRCDTTLGESASNCADCQ